VSDRQIGRIVSVDNFRVFIRLDDELSSTHKSGFNDIYAVARINSYLIIPVGSDRIVAMITRVKMQEVTEFDKNNQSISLPSSSRYVTATMLGTIESGNNMDQFIQGVYNFPVLDNPVWYVTTEDLDKIFDYKDSAEINYTKDFYLPIGTSPAFPDYNVKICPDQLFVKHAAVLGNTGSGKSCTLASILHALFDYKFDNEKYLKNAHFIIFDTNGEYEEAFITDGELFKMINAFHIKSESLKVPYWFMNWNDFDYLFEPRAGTQAPILKRAIGLAKNEGSQSGGQEQAGKLSNVEKNLINSIINHIENKALSEYWQIKNYSDAISALKLKKYSINGLILKDILGEIPIPASGQYDVPKPDDLEKVSSQLKIYLNKNNEQQRHEQVVNDKNIDLPVWFNYQKLITKFINAAIEEHEGSSSRINEYLSTLRLRLESFLNDQRIAEPLLLDSAKEFNESLAKFLAFILGDFYRLFDNKEKDDIFSTYFAEVSDEKLNKKRVSQITILDMALVPFDVLENVAGLIGRLIIEFVSHFAPQDRGKYPIVIILEEAQNYIPEKSRQEVESIAKNVFERIAREGRKYGISLIIASQRPAELSKTVLSQCNSFIVHRLQNPDDQKYIRGLVSSANSDILDQLPILPQQHAIVMGDCVRTPVQVRINDVAPIPNSDNPRFVEKWLEKQSDFPNYKEICNNWKDGKK